MVNIRETLMSGGAFRFLIDPHTGNITDTQANTDTTTRRRRARGKPCGKRPDGTKDHYECLQTGYAIGERVGLKEGKKEGRKRQEAFGKKQQALLGELVGDKAKQEEKERAEAKAKAEFAKSGKRMGEMYKKGKEIGIKKQKEFSKKQQALASAMASDKAKQAEREKQKAPEPGPSKEFQEKRQELASKLGKIQGKQQGIQQEKVSGRVRIEDATNDTLKGLLQKMQVPGYRPMLRPQILRELRARNINFVKLEGAGMTAYKSLKGKGCFSC